MNPFVAFDIEIANPFPDGVDDWQPFRPFGISCAATLTSEGQMTVWHGRTPDSDEPGDRMSRDEVAGLIAHLEGLAAGGHTILTWNGLGFDFDVLAEESGLTARCRDLALNHVDMMFHFFCMQGYALGLDRAAKGMGLAGKPPGMTGALAPRYWADGRRQEVMDYVQQDVRTTLDLALCVQAQRALAWIDGRGKPQRLRLPNGWLTVRQAMALPLPDVSFMRNPWSRRKFTGWMGNLPSPGPSKGVQSSLPGLLDD
jgi:hypothetical protein